MPYIKRDMRKKLNPYIDRLAAEIVKEAKGEKEETAFAGMLNYSCTRLALKIVDLQFGKMRYWILAILTGVFKNVADELYRRVGIPYETIQQKKNGDVDLYQTFSSQTKSR